jgi:hypothetical protein
MKKILLHVYFNDFLDWFQPELSESQHPVFGKICSGGGGARCELGSRPCLSNAFSEAPRYEPLMRFFTPTPALKTAKDDDV